MKKPLLLTIIVLMVTSCGDQKIDTTKARQEMEAREIKRVSEGEIVEKALNLGNQMSEGMRLLRESAETFSISGDGSSNQQFRFIPFSNIQQFAEEGKRFQIYDAYAYNAENGINSQPGVQILEGDTVLLYTSPAVFEEQTVGIFSLDLSRKEVVLSIKK